MKYLYTPIAILALALTACAGLTNSQFDNSEYGRYADIATHSRLLLAKCDNFPNGAVDPALLHREAIYAVAYSSLKLQNQRVTAAGTELRSLTKELSDRYSVTTPSVGYCQLKLGQIAVASEAIATSIGKKEH
jgi:hypothetical protein